MKKKLTVEQILVPFTKKFTNYKKIEKGYEILRKDGTLQKIHDIKLVITRYEYQRIKESSEIQIFEFLTIKDLEFYNIQFITKYLLEGPSLIRALSLARVLDEPLCFPLKRKWINEFNTCDIPVNNFICSLMWRYFMLIKTLKEISSTFTFIFKSHKKDNKFDIPLDINNRLKVYMPGAQKNHLLNKNSSEKQHNFSNWLSSAIYPRKKLHIFHSSSVKSEVCEESDRVTASSLNGYLYQKVNLVYFTRKMYIFSILVSKLFHLKFNRILLISNCSKVCAAVFQESFNSTDKMDTIIFDISQGIVKPLWAVIAEKKGCKIIFCFYAIAAEPQFMDGAKVRDGLWFLSTWMEFWVTDKIQMNMLSELCPNYEVIYKEIGIPEWVDSGELFVPPVKPFISVFDTEPHKNFYSLSNTQAFGLYDRESIKNFFETILNTAESLGFSVIHKTKRDIGNNRAHFYRGLLTHIEKKYPNIYIRVDDTIAPSRIISKSFAVISTPVSTTAVIARNLGIPSIFYDSTAIISGDDSALRGIKVISSSVKLAEWLSVLGSESRRINLNE